MTGFRVLIAEDHEGLRAIVVALLSSEFQIVGAVGDGVELVQSAIFLKPDVIISDINMPLMDGFGARNELRSKGIQCPFVFITSMQLEAILPECGAPVGYVHKTDLFNELNPAIHTVLVGNNYMSRAFKENPEGL